MIRVENGWLMVNGQGDNGPVAIQISHVKECRPKRGTSSTVIIVGSTYEDMLEIPVPYNEVLSWLVRGCGP